MDKHFVEKGEAEGRDTASRFLSAIKNQDAVTFWNLLDKKGQGYFMGMWFFSLADAGTRTIEGLSGESAFLTSALGPVIEALRSNLEDLLEDPSFGRINYIDSQHARVPLLNTVVAHPPGEGQEREESIPLVLELASVDQTNANLTCWKVDTFRCIQFGKAT